MKIGLIARAEETRGLAIQSRNFHDNMPVERTLVVDMPKPDAPIRDDWYPSATHIAYDDSDHTIDEGQAREWMAGLDVVFTAETPYDWRLPTWAREMGVKTIVQGNPEFYRHHLPAHAHLAHPDAWWWPTGWRPTLSLPRGEVMPVPMPGGISRVPHAVDGPLRAVHVIGKPAYMDRNGSEILMQALRFCRADIKMTIATSEGSIPAYDLKRSPNVELNIITTRPDGSPLSTDDLYAGQSVLVMPRRYGGLCLPALEAAVRGVAVVMPNIPPNAEMGQLLVLARRERMFGLSCGHVRQREVANGVLGEYLDLLARNTHRISEAQDVAFATVPRWSIWRPRYLKAMEDLCAR